MVRHGFNATLAEILWFLNEQVASDQTKSVTPAGVGTFKHSSKDCSN
jgi:hypothetical protein